MTRVQLQHVGKQFPGHGRSAAPVVAVDDVSIDIASGEIHAVIGYSGAGKSTLLRLINGLETVTSGQIVVGETEITGLSESGLREVRRGIGMIFQQFNLFGSRTVRGNVAYPLRVSGVPRGEREERVTELLSFVGLEDKGSAHIEQLSGGQKQRVGIARALATNPGVLLADEATSALDPETSQEVLALLQRVNRELGITIVLITHEMEVVRSIAHRVTVMESGRVVEQGDVFDVFSAPQTSTAKRFVATALPWQPTGAHIEQLKREHRGTLVTVHFSGSSVDQPVIFRALADRGVDVSILYGGVSEAGGRTFGWTTLELMGDPAAVDSAIAHVATQTRVEEL